MFAVTIMLTMGILLVPTLMLEEKQTRTMDALLVSPASISQVVIGKAIAGFFYILVTAAIVYLIYWTTGGYRQCSSLEQVCFRWLSVCCLE
jgi:ABC-2 type transport system permease protein